MAKYNPQYVTKAIFAAIIGIWAKIDAEISSHQKRLGGYIWTLVVKMFPTVMAKDGRYAKAVKDKTLYEDMLQSSGGHSSRARLVVALLAACEPDSPLHKNGYVKVNKSGSLVIDNSILSMSMNAMRAVVRLWRDGDNINTRTFKRITAMAIAAETDEACSDVRKVISKVMPNKKQAAKSKVDVQKRASTFIANLKKSEDDANVLCFYILQAVKEDLGVDVYKSNSGKVSRGLGIDGKKVQA